MPAFPDDPLCLCDLLFATDDFGRWGTPTAAGGLVMAGGFIVELLLPPWLLTLLMLTAACGYGLGRGGGCKGTGALERTGRPVVKGLIGPRLVVNFGMAMLGFGCRGGAEMAPPTVGVALWCCGCNGRGCC